MRLRLATRGSPLARAQAERVRADLAALGAEVEVQIVRTTGDRSDRPFAELEGVGFFVKEIEEALLSGLADVAVHSLKDLPTVTPDGLVIAAVLEREDPRDALITRDGGGLAALEPGARVATSSPRRRAQLLAVRPDLEFVETRGNVDTRLRKLALGQFDALVLAIAGLRRLGREREASEVLAVTTVLPAPGQGAIAIETRAGDPAEALVRRLDHAATRAAVEAERAFLLALGGGCSVPVGALGEVAGDVLRLEGLIADPRSGRVVRGRVEGVRGEATRLGSELAEQVRAAGGGEVLAALLAVRPLAGRRVIVTRAPGQSDGVSAQLRALGAEVVVCAAIEVVPPEDPAALVEAARRAGAGGYDLVAFTSVNAVAAFTAALAEAGVAPGKLGPKLAAVGPATAGALAAHDLVADLVSDQASGEGLGQALKGLVGPGSRVLLPRAAEAGRALPEALVALGAELTEVEAYRTVSPPALAGELARAFAAAPIDAIAFFSPSAVRHVMAAASAEVGRRIRERLTVACIGPTTAAAARAADLRVHARAEAATGEALVAALVETLAPGPGASGIPVVRDP